MKQKILTMLEKELARYNTINSKRQLRQHRNLAYLGFYLNQRVTAILKISLFIVS